MTKMNYEASQAIIARAIAEVTADQANATAWDALGMLGSVAAYLRDQRLKALGY